MKRGILLLGHGSRRSTANTELVALAELVQGGLGMRVAPAYFQFERPNLTDTVEQLVSEGVTEIVVVPALLFPGVHMKDDIPTALKDLQTRYGERVHLIMTEGFGPDPRLAEIVMERVHAAIAGDSALAPDGRPQAGSRQDELTDPGQITSRSRSLIESSLGLLYLDQFPPREGEIVRRVVHALGNPDAAHLLRFHPEAVDAGLAALRRGATLLTDVRMVKMGINRAVLRGLGGRVVCMTHHPRTAALAREQGLTRSMMGVRVFRQLLTGNLAVIGNAPTALAEVLRQSEDGFRPALIVGTPVGFVGAAEVKARLSGQGVPYITMIGHQGGSTVAVSIVNALLALAEGRPGL
jgi:precorrin-8X/cobalt-precorrin-8 methylmutase